MRIKIAMALMAMSFQANAVMINGTTVDPEEFRVFTFTQSTQSVTITASSAATDFGSFYIVPLSNYDLLLQVLAIGQSSQKITYAPLHGTGVCASSISTESHGATCTPGPVFALQYRSSTLPFARTDYSLWQSPSSIFDSVNIVGDVEGVKYIPVPATLPLIGLGLAGLLFRRKK